MKITLKKELRKYQKDALEYALNFSDAVCVLPTGTGKTLIGIAWAVELLNKGVVKRVLALEPSRFLVEQTHKRYLKDTTLSDRDVNWVYGILSKEEREMEEIWEKGIVVVCTPHTAFNDIHLLKDFDAVIVDECHHTTGKYTYVKLLSQYNFKYKLGLTATLSEKVRNEVETFISRNIRVWTWEELKTKYPQYKFPDWIGEVYDSELEEKEIDFLQNIEKLPLNSFSRSFCLRTFTRDGALALKETILNPKTKLSKEFPEKLKNKFSELRELHKIEIVENILNEHDFEKAIIFVDRVCVANKIFEKFQNLNPVLFLGRLRIGLEKQKEVLEKAQKPEYKLIISTSAGEEGVDLPTVDLLIIWSNVASPIRFIQRLGRITRPSEKLKVVTFVATPGTVEINSPDYDSLVDGLILAKKNGVDIAGLEDEELIKILKTKSFRNRIITLLESHPLTLNEIVEKLGFQEKGQKRVEKWLSSCVKEKDEEFRVYYFYYFPYEEIKRRVEEGLKQYKDLLSDEALKRFGINFESNLRKENRFYFSSYMIYQIEFEKGFSQYFPSVENIQINIPYINYKIEECKGVKNRKCILKGEFKIDEQKFVGIIEGEKLEKFEKFTTMIKEIHSHIRDKYVGINFSSGNEIPLKRLYFNGKFNEKALELVFRNAIYIILNMKKLIEEFFKN
jgi:superfamily II DNA or RNA helicase